MSASNLRATGRWVIVRPGELPQQTSGGILYNPAWQQKPTNGTVLSVGERVPESVREALPAGAVVAYSWINGTDIEWAGEKLKAIDWRELNGVLEQEAA